ncbi:beta-propeller fold lactonase family protein [Chitinophaga sp. ysch24]|uniref:Beta-propeller fold lactonase family protein n=1 Tax=Chitinophaga tropicalis TaxID=2683588 RepID=A0A7K1U2I7_9BACT|nr:beta-propeller fold lactonase family protein [Chitinophaga tropicalis]
MLKKYYFLLTLALLSSYCSLAQSTYLFIGSYNGDKDKEGLYVYRFDTETGSLSKVSAYHVFNPSFLTLSPDGKYIYACTETRTPGMGSVSSFAFDSKTGNVRFISKQDSGGENPVYVTVHRSGKWLINGNYTGGSISVYHLSDDGSIAPAVQVIPFKDSSIRVQQKSAHIHSVNFSPQQDYIFSPDLGADKIRAYAFDTEHGEPLKITGFVSTVPGSGPRHMAFHPNGKFVYNVEELAGAVSVYRYHNGQLDSIQRIMAHDGKPLSFYSSADIHFSPDGRFLYVSNRGEENNIAIFSVNGKTGRLKPEGFQDTGGEHPRNFTIDPSGKFLLVANQIGNNIVVFRRDARTGLLTKTGTEIKVTAPSCLLIRTYL